MELVEVALYVRDMERAIRFYRDTVGLELDFESEHPTFLVTEAEIERARLAGAGIEVTDIPEPVADTQVFDARDPDGNRFSIESQNRR